MHSTNLINWFQLNFPEMVQAMKQSDHNWDGAKLNPFHSEGDVWTHLCMVMKIAEIRGLSKVECVALLLHDLGKPYTMQRDSDSRKVKFFGHESFSVFLAEEVMKHLDLTHDEKVEVIKLIYYHTTIFKEWDGQRYSKKFLDTLRGEQSLFEKILQIGICDQLGRFTVSDSTQDILKMLETRLPFKDKIDNTLPTWDDSKPTVTFLVGLPGVGKSTYVANGHVPGEVISSDLIIEDFAKMENLSYNDAWRKYIEKADGILKERFTDAVKRGVDVVIDQTNLTAKARRGRQSYFKNYNHRAVILFNDFSQLEQILQNRADKTGKRISKDLVYQMATTLSLPNYSQFQKIDYVFLDSYF